MKQFRVVTAPAALPVTLAEAKIDARVDHDDDDALLTGLIAAATERAEGWARRAFVTRTCELALDGWPAGYGEIALPMPPLVSVVQVAYFDWQNARHVVDASEYIVYTDVVPGLVSPLFDRCWPQPVQLRPISPIRVMYTAGYGAPADVPEIYKQLIRALVVIDYEHREGMTPDGLRKIEMVRARLQADWGW